MPSAVTKWGANSTSQADPAARVADQIRAGDLGTCRGPDQGAGIGEKVPGVSVVDEQDARRDPVSNPSDSDPIHHNGDCQYQPTCVCSGSGAHRPKCIPGPARKRAASRLGAWRPWSFNSMRRLVFDIPTIHYDPARGLRTPVVAPSPNLARRGFARATLSVLLATDPAGYVVVMIGTRAKPNLGDCTTEAGS